jgi:calcium channel MID1
MNFIAAERSSLSTPPKMATQYCLETAWMLPHALLCLLQAALITAQTRQQLSLNSLSSFSSQSLPNPPAFSLPSSDALAVSVAVCSGDLQSSLPRFFVTNDTSVGIPRSGGGANVFEIFLDAGLGNWTGPASNGGVLAVENAGQSSFEVGVSNTGEFLYF